MAHASELERLVEQRRFLVARSAELRAQLSLDLGQLHRSVAWLERAHALAQASRPAWPILAGLVGLLLARPSRGLLGKAGKLLSWWRLAKKLSQLWLSWQIQT